MSPTFSQTRWRLDDLFSSLDDSNIEAALDETEARVTEFESLRSSLRPDLPIGDFIDCIRRLENVALLSSRVNGYADLKFAEDTGDQRAQAFVARIEEVMTGLQNRILFFELWWKGLDESEAARLMAGAPGYRYWLEEMRRFKPHTLSEPEERVINVKNVTGAGALVRLYDSMTNRYLFRIEEDGRQRQVTRGELMVYARHHDPDKRAAAYRELYRVYGENGPILGQVYQTLVRDWKSEHVDLRKYPNPLSVRNLNNDIPDDVVEVLLDVCRKNAALFQRYFRIKAARLGLDRLRRYDIYAPVTISDKTYDFGQAANMVLDAFRQFDPRFSDLARRVFEEGHLDGEIRPGKRDGAFCASILPGLTP
ncbi:MAG: oligoendopeptidase F, partial [Proteobacteria bacterium]|nr:oligoendopeptidase F [Pseudomonadota bacterium]